MKLIVKGIKGHDLPLNPKDKVSLKFAMLFEGLCTLGVQAAIKKYGYTEQRFYQLLSKFEKEGASALIDKKRGPNNQSVRTKEVKNQIIRLRFLDPLANTGVISQKLNQMGYNVSIRSVERTITEFGLQKKLIR
ncbi:MAG: helix-turn-helix domain-containing protein [Bacteroidales bacterium]|nr:helix-turn-helix domain-containing protein [Bacteroidales bacterium]